MKKFWLKYKEIIIISGYLTLYFVLIYAVAVPIMRDINIKSDKIQEALLLQESKRNKLASLPAYQSQAQRIAEDGKKLDVFASRENAIVLIERIETVAQEVGVDIVIEIDEKNDPKVAAKKNVEKKKDAPKTLIEELVNENYLKLNIAFAGDYGQVTNFLHKIETMEYMNDVVSLQVKKNESVASEENRNRTGVVIMKTDKKENDEPRGALQASMGVVFYLQPE